jgi:thiosulfate/3-mercaptopyruvate sulfurtransferase
MAWPREVAYFPMMLISMQQLVEMPDAVIVDCRFDLMNPEAGYAAWQAGHIPGAFYADLDKDLASPRLPDSGRHPLPDPQAFAQLMGSWGVQPDTLVVAYDNVGGAIAARLWWLLGWAGHAHAALLDGGLQAWQESGMSLSSDDTPAGGSEAYPIKPGTFRELDARSVSEGLSQGDLTLVDARDPVRFAGGAEPIDSVAGHIPGALNRPFNSNLADSGCFKAADALRAEFMQLFDGQPEEVACMCGSGVTACHNLFAMHLAGLPPGALYVGSWSGWITDPERPVAAE